MFLNSIRGEEHRPADLSLLIPPAAQKVLEGAPLEELLMARDEVANMVWAIERTIPLPSGDPKRGREAAGEPGTHTRRTLNVAWERPPHRNRLRKGQRSAIA